MTFPLSLSSGAWPTSRPAADATPGTELIWASTDAGTDGVLTLPGWLAPDWLLPDARGVTAASTFFAPAAKLLK